MDKESAFKIAKKSSHNVTSLDLYNDSNIMKLMQAIVIQSVGDYIKAKKMLEKCKSYKCDKCKKIAGNNCEDEIKVIQDFFEGALFSAAYPNIDGKWFLHNMEEYVKDMNKTDFARIAALV